jgi:hypothetical protein
MVRRARLRCRKVLFEDWRSEGSHLVAFKKHQRCIANQAATRTQAMSTFALFLRV